jgi:hypothetical protein
MADGNRRHPGHGLGGSFRLLRDTHVVHGDAVKTVSVPTLPGVYHLNSVRPGEPGLENAAVVRDKDRIAPNADSRTGRDHRMAMLAENVVAGRGATWLTGLESIVVTASATVFSASLLPATSAATLKNP